MFENALFETITRRIRETQGDQDVIGADRLAYFKMLGKQIFEMPESRMLAREMATRIQTGRAVTDDRLDDLHRKLDALKLRVEALEQTRC